MTAGGPPALTQEATLGERERGYRRVTMLTGGLAAVSIAGTLGVAMAAHAAHTAEQETVVPAGVVPGDPPPPAVEDGQSAPDGAPPATADPAAEAPAAGEQPPAEEFPEVTDGGDGPGQATTGGS
ncbi:hypothetical protein O7623_08100 [Solwaraspora sp. WMMD791]|uniref:hypothetical protein n=1 Tax=Solwaraspora sp. WMMD791 TaxID=3016086 RepID=UPI00249B2CDB|nr:hypothetical protein [Solwaraspora sp. WMMD791]WFE29136.1 hypothetical protein O7623_08100 [Solwaraspora sp. WMMD791]